MARPKGMKAFTFIWAGQVVSLIGSAMTAFAVSVWAWEITGRATAFSVVSFFNFMPLIVMCPLAGALVDRWDRKLTMGISDVASGLGTVIMLILYTTGHLQIWHLCLTGALSGTFQAFQWPAYQAAISTMVSPKDYGRASGMMSLAQSGSGILAPIVAGAIVTSRGPVPVFIIDIVTFCLAVGILFMVDVPQPKRSKEGERARTSIWKDMVFGWRYILARQPLFQLQLSFFVVNLLASVCMTLWNPMILARTGNDSTKLGLVNTVSAIGGVAGGALMTVWGGPKRKVRGVLGGMIAVAVLGIMLMGFGRTVPIWLLSGFLGSLLVPLMNGCNDAIWQAKVPHDVQGRVFGTRMMIAQISVPVSMLVAGPLADYLFEPGMMPGGRLVPVFGMFTGTGRGAGMAAMYLLFGAATLVAAIVSALSRNIRDVELLLPDYAPPEEQAAAPASVSAEAELLRHEETVIK